MSDHWKYSTLSDFIANVRMVREMHRVSPEPFQRFGSGLFSLSKPPLGAIPAPPARTIFLLVAYVFLILLDLIGLGSLRSKGVPG